MYNLPAANILKAFPLAQAVTIRPRAPAGRPIQAWHDPNLRPKLVGSSPDLLRKESYIGTFLATKFATQYFTHQ